jgi:septal ring factor EnvC (AmiA/AmiB activator)
MRLHLAFALAWIIANPAPGWAQSALASDTVLRAAYCLGVLNAEIGEWNKNVPPADEGCAVWADNSKTQCLGKNSELAELLTELNKSSEQKRRRYAQYLAVQLPNLEKMRTSILAIITKGKTDYQNSVASASEAMAMVSKCAKSCGDVAGAGTSQCSIDCIAQRDQVQANIMKCTSQPDQLPF